MTAAGHRIALRARDTEHHIYGGRSLLVTNLGGTVTGAGLEGFYVENTRLLSCLDLDINGVRPHPIAVSPVGGARFFAYAEVPPEAGVPLRALILEVARVVGDGLRQELRLTNYHRQERLHVALALHVAADFADIYEAKSGHRQQTGPVETTWDEPDRELRFRYGHPRLDRAVAIRVVHAPAPVCWDDGALRFALDLAPHQAADLHLTVEPIFDGRRGAAPSRVFGGPVAGLERVRAGLRAEIPRLSTTNATVTAAWETATHDLASLPLGAEPGPAAPIAGLPLYQQLFGRDTLTISWQAALALPSLLHDALRANAAHQGTKIDDWFDEEPGKLLHQARRGPLSELGFDPFLHYFGDYATPPDFLMALGQYLAWTGDLATTRALLPAARRAIAWLDRYGDLDGDGFLEYVTRSAQGEKNQGWKDSYDAIVYESGETVPNPIATCELQGYWYVGLRQVALAFLAAGDPLTAWELRRKAAALQAHFDRAFWMEDEGFYALALDPHKRQVRTIASNAGQLLATGIVPRAKGRQVARRLLAPDLFSGWGVRTLSTAHPSFNPFAYHLGSVWPVEAGTIAFGLARYGRVEELHRLAEATFALSDLFAEHRLPETVGGVPRDAQHPHPGMYPESNEPQGWSASAVVVTIQALLGLRPIAPLGLVLVDPQLPEWLPDLRLTGVHVGQASLDLAFHRDAAGTTHFRVERCAGDVRVLRQPVPQSPAASLPGRLRAAATSVWHS